MRELGRGEGFKPNNTPSRLGEMNIFWNNNNIIMLCYRRYMQFNALVQCTLYKTDLPQVLVAGRWNLQVDWKQ